MIYCPRIQSVRKSVNVDIDEKYGTVEFIKAKLGITTIPQPVPQPAAAQPVEEPQAQLDDSLPLPLPPLPVTSTAVFNSTLVGYKNGDFNINHPRLGASFEHAVVVNATNASRAITLKQAMLPENRAEFEIAVAKEAQSFLDNNVFASYHDWNRLPRTPTSSYCLCT